MVRKYFKKENLAKVRSYLKKENIDILITLSLLTYFFILSEIVLITLFYGVLYFYYLEFIFWQVIFVGVHLFNVYFSYKKRYHRRFIIFLILILSGIGLGILIYFQFYPVLSILIFFIALLCISSIGAYYSMKHSKRDNLEVKPWGKYCLIILFLSFIASISFLTFSSYTIQIKPKNSPEIVFWGSVNNIPNNTAIAFAPVVNPGAIGSSVIKDKIQEAVNNSMDLYIALGMVSEFFLNIDNAPYIVDLYRNFSNWLNETLKSDHIKGILIDAESPVRYVQKSSELPLNEYINYLFENYPTKEEIEIAENNLNTFIELVHADNKEAILIKNPSVFDEMDWDGDLTLLFRNIYSLNVNWDSSITMLYRNQGMIEENFFTAITTKLFWGERTEDLLELSEYWFYYEAKVADGIFIGDFNKNYNESNFIKNKGYLKDFDICRYLSKKNVFFYQYDDFIYHYGQAGIDELVAHNQQFDSWDLTYYAYEVQSNFIYLMALMYIDRVLFLGF
jgi:hypothetical protein